MSSTALVARLRLGCFLLSFSSFHTPVRVGFNFCGSAGDCSMQQYGARARTWMTGS